MTVIERYPKYIFVLMNVSVVAWWALLSLGRFPTKLSLLVLLFSLAGMNFTLLITKYIVKRRRRSP
jgi:hypothetical protein